MSQKKLNNEELETRLQFYKLKAEHLEKQIEELKDKMETWQAELFDKLAEVTQIIDDYSIEIDLGKATPSLMIIGSKEFENVIDEIMDKFTKLEKEKNNVV